LYPPYRQARRRNRRALSDGRVDIALAPAERLLFADAAFTAALSVNSVAHWNDVPAGLAELHRVLARGGRLVLALRAQSDPVSMDPHARGATPQRVDDLVALLTTRGFAAIERRTHARKRELLVTLSARRA
jgi:ubiquinone/menaquinone biosynthesis C-methylase UbiE